MNNSVALWATLALVACGSEVVPIASQDAKEHAAEPALPPPAAVTRNERVACPLDAGAGDDATPDASSDAGSPVADADPPALAWYATCGYPVCPVPPDGDAPPASTCALKGTPCTNKGETCGDGRFTCGSKMV